MAKKVRIPLTTPDGRDFMTGKPVTPREVEQSLNQSKKIKNWLKSKRSEAEALGLKKGYIKVEGLGVVKM